MPKPPKPANPAAVRARNALFMTSSCFPTRRRKHRHCQEGADRLATPPPPAVRTVCGDKFALPTSADLIGSVYGGGRVRTEVAQRQTRKKYRHRACWGG